MRQSTSVAKDFVGMVSSLSFENAFNPYADLCPDFDRPNAPAIRRRNLVAALGAAIDRGVETVWVARDLGYRGGRRTGLALTDEAHLGAHARLLGVRALERSTLGPTVAERTATVIWRMLMTIGQPVFLWNVFPLHPHEHGKPMSNRCHSKSERLACREVMVTLLDILAPDFVLAIGNDAESALADIGIVAEKVRHPSYGGQSEFIDGVSRRYGLDLPKSGDTLPLFA